MKKLIIDFMKHDGVHPIIINSVKVEMVESFKFFGINITYLFIVMCPR